MKRKIEVPTVDAVLASKGCSLGFAEAFVEGEKVAAAHLDLNPDATDEELNRVREAVIDDALRKLNEAERRKRCPVPTLAEVEGSGYSTEAARSIVRGALERHFRFAEAGPTASDIIALGFDEKEAEEILAALWNQAGQNAAELTVERTDRSDLRCLLNLVRQGMKLNLELSGHVAGPKVAAWLREVDELEAGLQDEA